MTQLVSDGGVGGTDNTPEPFKPIDPFLDDDGNETSSSFEVTKPVMLVQLQDEIEERLGKDVQVSTASADLNAETSESNPMTLYVSSDGGVDDSKVQAVIKSHAPDWEYGLTQEQKDARTLTDKIAAGEHLSPDEVTQALQLLLTRQSTV